MVGQKLGIKWLEKWHCENCGWEGLNVFAILEDAPKCNFWRHGNCVNQTMHIFRDEWRCPYTDITAIDCEGWISCQRLKS